MNKLINFVLFQSIWLALILGVAAGNMMYGVFLFLIFSVWQLWPSNKHKDDASILVLCVTIGTIVDSLWAYFGLVKYGQALPIEGIAPYWILMLWVTFALSVNHSLAWIHKNKVLGLLFGAIGGPLSYLAAEKLGAVVVSSKIVSLPLLSLSWTLVMFLILYKPFGREDKMFSENKRPSELAT